jgi:hypothetical protein
MPGGMSEERKSPAEALSREHVPIPQRSGLSWYQLRRKCLGSTSAGSENRQQFHTRPARQRRTAFQDPLAVITEKIKKGLRQGGKEG